MRIPVIPFMLSLVLLMAASLLVLMQRTSWPLFTVMFINFTYSSHREIWHNGQPLALWKKK